jgi:glucosamine-6-phosphate deaminase
MPRDTAAQLRVFQAATEVASAVADAIERAIAATPTAVLSLATGRTPLATYEELARRHRAGRLDVSRATLFAIDEFAGIPPSHPGSFASYIEEHLVTPLGFDPRRVQCLDGVAANLDLECARYERAIERSGGIDLMLLSIGANGHIGFNEPADTLTGPTHVVRLDASTRRNNAARFGGRADAVPSHAVSMGMTTILRAARILLVATGREKAACIERALHGPLTTQMPASWLQFHRAVDVYLDRDAASLLPAAGAALRAG